MSALALHHVVADGMRNLRALHFARRHNTPERLCRHPVSIPQASGLGGRSFVFPPAREGSFPFLGRSLAADRFRPSLFCESVAAGPVPSRDAEVFLAFTNHAETSRENSSK